ncbi:MAG: nuclear transport factor 2 family protein [Microbacterium sp.]
MVTNEELFARLDDIERRLAEREAEADIIRALFRLGHTIDYGDNDLWVDGFAEDAKFEMVEVSSEGRVIRVQHSGRDALAAFIPGHTHAPEHFHKHLIADPIVVLDGDRAHVESYMARIDKGDSGPFLWSMGRYLDDFVRSSDGRWRVVKRTIEVESRFAPVKASDIGASAR